MRRKFAFNLFLHSSAYKGKEVHKMEKIVLFDGTDLNGFVRRYGGEPTWKLEDGFMTVVEGNIVSKETFGDAHIHLEWREPMIDPEKYGQARGNSGVFIHGCYELQVLDSFDVEEGRPHDRDCGSIYEMYKPLQNACRPMMEWQSYDIYFRAPRFDENGNMTDCASATIFQNGLLIQNNIPLHRTTPGGLNSSNPIAAEGPLELQDHGDPVSFRNIYIEKY